LEKIKFSWWRKFLIQKDAWKFKVFKNVGVSGNRPVSSWHFSLFFSSWSSILYYSPLFHFVSHIHNQILLSLFRFFALFDGGATRAPPPPAPTSGNVSGETLPPQISGRASPGSSKCSSQGFTPPQSGFEPPNQASTLPKNS
jgi:hypothetical protein